MIEHKCGIIGRSALREGAVAVCEINQTLQVLKRPFGNQLINVLEHRAEIRTAAAAQCKILHKLRQLLLGGDPFIHLHRRIALYDMHVHFMEKAFTARKNRVGFL